MVRLALDAQAWRANTSMPSSPHKPAQAAVVKLTTMLATGGYQDAALERVG